MSFRCLLVQKCSWKTYCYHERNYLIISLILEATANRRRKIFHQCFLCSINLYHIDQILRKNRTPSLSGVKCQLQAVLSDPVSSYWSCDKFQYFYGDFYGTSIHRKNYSRKWICPIPVYPRKWICHTHFVISHRILDFCFCSMKGFQFSLFPRSNLLRNITWVSIDSKNEKKENLDPCLMIEQTISAPQRFSHMNI